MCSHFRSTSYFELIDDISQEIVSNDMRGAGMQYSDRWKRWRKIQVSGMSGRASLTYQQFQLLESTVLMHNLMKSTKSYMQELTRHVHGNADVQVLACSTREVMCKAQIEALAKIQNLHSNAVIIDDTAHLSDLRGQASECNYCVETCE